MHQNSFSAGHPAGVAYDAPQSPDPLVGWGGDTPLHTVPLDDFGLSISAPPNKIPGCAYGETLLK